MNAFIEIDSKAAALVFGGKDEATAKVVEFIAECIGSIAKMIWLASRMKRMLTSPGTL
ncbi:MAG: hypothetical protein J6Q34_06510 [Bacteroidales bacterium]|jgi:hypothetical protein|nr:hypothetical protein [Bacteroidales bacterium]